MRSNLSARFRSDHGIFIITFLHIHSASWDGVCGKLSTAFSEQGLAFHVVDCVRYKVLDGEQGIMLGNGRQARFVLL